MHRRRFPEEFNPILDVISSFRTGQLDPTRDTDLHTIREAVGLVRANKDNPALCSTIIVSDIEAGMPITFKYRKPDCNEFWRFGVVHLDPEQAFISGCWRVFTFNLKRKRVKDKLVKCGPEWRSYRTEEMDDIRHVAAPAIPSAAPRAEDMFAELGKGVKKLIRDMGFEGQEKGQGTG